MIMKYLHFKHILLFFLIIQCHAVWAQSLSVVGFRLLDDDMTASTRGTMKQDQNGDIAAIIKVITTENDFSFDVGIMGVLGTLQKEGEIWVYVPGGVQRITITHSDLGVLRDYYFPVSIEGGRTYELQLTSVKVRTVVEEEITTQYVVFNVMPLNAVVYIDDEQYDLNGSGVLSVRLERGIHTYKVTADTYIPEMGTIDVNSEKLTKDIDLESAKATLFINTSNDAGLFINDSYYGRGSNTVTLNPGEYVVEARISSYRTARKEIILREKEQDSLTLEPVPMYGKLEVESNPMGSTVYVDGESKGKTPLTIKEILVGTHVVRIEKDKYKTVNLKIIVAEDSLTIINNDLTALGEHEYVDLGLSVKWAKCNIGAESPEESGYFYAWGETDVKKLFMWSTYKFGDNRIVGEMEYRNGATLKKKDDVAYVAWGGKWRIPTKAEYEELISECTWNWTVQNGVKGYEVTGKNGNHIFLPAASTGDYVIYWSSTCTEDKNNSKAYCLRQKKTYLNERYNGYPIRPVRK